ncbi:MAG: hypothetical protein M1830_008791 [Pleopsidium flavum]|nr:MAG: hypothetical protein M1830_008791 [Pleopsidium flavum]
MASFTPIPLSQRAQSNLSWFNVQYGHQITRLSSSAVPIDLMTAENWLMRDTLVENYKTYLSKHLCPKHLSYSDGWGGDKALLQAAADAFSFMFQAHTPVLPSHIVVGSGCSSILEGLLYDVCEEGEGLLVEAPFWGLYLLSLRRKQWALLTFPATFAGGFAITFTLRNKIKAVPVSLPRSVTDTQHVSAYIAHYEKALRSAPCKVAGLLFCNPHNPHGRLYSKAVLEALLHFCERENLHFISDEIYAMSTFGPLDTKSEKSCNGVLSSTFQETTFTSVLKINLEELGVNPSRVHMLYSLSKDLGSSGLRLGFLITQHHPALRHSISITTHSTASTLSSLAALSLLTSPSLCSILDQNRLRLRRNAEIVTSFLAANNIEFCPPVAGVYVWARLGATLGGEERATLAGDQEWEEEDEVRKRCEAVGVLLGPGKGYMAEEPGWFRVVFAVEEGVLREALSRLARALELGESGQTNPVNL